jgi:hypothetical protein
MDGQNKRGPLRDMTPRELDEWLLGQRAELEDFCSSAQDWYQWRQRRHLRQRGHQTDTDVRYARFFDQAGDLIAGLDELRALLSEKTTEE